MKIENSIIFSSRELIMTEWIYSYIIRTEGYYTKTSSWNTVSIKETQDKCDLIINQISHNK